MHNKSASDCLNVRKRVRTFRKLLPEKLNLLLILLVLLRQSLIGVAQSRLQILNSVVTRHELALRLGHFLLEACVLLDELFLDSAKLFQIVFEEFEFALLGARVGGTGNDFILLSNFIELHLKFYHLQFH